MKNLLSGLLIIMLVTCSMSHGMADNAAHQSNKSDGLVEQIAAILQGQVNAGALKPKTAQDIYKQELQTLNQWDFELKSDNQPFTTNADEFASKHSPYTLKGVSNYQFIVSVAGEIPPDLSKDEIQTACEVKLRQAGIDIQSSSESDNYAPVLALNICSLKGPPLPQSSDGLFYAVDYTLSLSEPIRLPRRHGVVFGTTWETSSLVVAGRDRTRDAKEYILDLIDIFINDYLKANPKKD